LRAKKLSFEYRLLPDVFSMSPWLCVQSIFNFLWWELFVYEVSFFLSKLERHRDMGV
jgi:hypothetical protein